ncbi:MAG: Crp/Fnr family transcriptional regulator [Magnetococcales bacterium]|nr:Crp/Fnr family transcriptional regulator [Magnetococcales bacterium]
MLTGAVDQDRKRLLALWRQLGEEERRGLLRFAQCLANESREAETVEPAVADLPLAIPRPAVESAVAGLKRLKKTYPMIEADERVLGEASRILMQKVLGAADAEVIDQLEAFFAQRYQGWREGRG